MDIMQHTFSQEEIQQLCEYRDKQRDGRLKIRLIALLMVDEVFSRGHGFCRWSERQNPDDLGTSLRDRRHRPFECLQLSAEEEVSDATQLEQLVVWVRDTHPAKTKQVKAYIAEQFQVTYTVEAVRQLLHKQGLKRLRPAVQPGNPPSEDEQRAFVTKDETRKAESKPDTVFLFGDAMHRSASK